VRGTAIPAPNKEHVTRSMHFMNIDRGWFCQFLEPDLKTSLPRKLRFASPAKIREMYDRFGIDKKLEDRSALDYGITTTGRGSVWLSLTPEQYNKLKR
jgi:hypothetical protein